MRRMHVIFFGGYVIKNYLVNMRERIYSGARTRAWNAVPYFFQGGNMFPSYSLLAVICVKRRLTVSTACAFVYFKRITTSKISRKILSYATA
jgi:hypothetical protein